MNKQFYIFFKKNYIFEKTYRKLQSKINYFMKKIYLPLFLLFFTSGFAQVGINTQSPTRTLDVNGNARIRNIDLQTTAPNFVVVSDADGNIRKVNPSDLTSGTSASYSPKIAGIFRLTNDFNCNGCDRVAIPFDQTVSVNPEFLQINSNGNYTVLSTGLYEFSVQVGVVNVTAATDIIIGIVDSTGSWIGRATFRTTGTNRDFRVYKTTLNFTAGQSFTIGFNATSGLVQGTQTGSTGNGNVTNFTLVKY